MITYRQIYCWVCICWGVYLFTYDDEFDDDNMTSQQLT